MAEDNNSLGLDSYTFTPIPESRAAIGNLEVAFQELKQKYPYLSGFGVFGSRAKGTEHPQSDYDICIFYDSDKITGLQSGNKDQWQQIILTVGQALGAPLDHRILDKSEGFRVDISKTQTDKHFEMFIEAASPFINQDFNDTVLNNVGIPPTQDLYSRFFMVFGDEVHKNKEYILKKLTKIPDGDKYLQILMKSLEWFEKGKENE